MTIIKICVYLVCFLGYSIGMNASLSLEHVSLYHFKNVAYGKVSLPSSSGRASEGSRMLGLYGANGLGKTAFVEALVLLKALLSGDSLAEGNWTQ